jgi:Putative transposon-encoded protein (DUF2080)
MTLFIGKHYGRTSITNITPSGNSGHVVVPKAWIGKKAIVTLKGKDSSRTRREKQ